MATATTVKARLNERRKALVATGVPLVALVVYVVTGVNLTDTQAQEALGVLALVVGALVHRVPNKK